MENNELIETKVITLKNNKTLNLNLSYNSDNNYYQIDAIIDDKNVGFANYKFNRYEVWLNHIEVTDENYLSCGIGKAMIDYFEEHCLQRRQMTISGKFYPTGKGSHLTRAFYERNGYKIEKDGYETYIDKSLYNFKTSSSSTKKNENPITK